MTNGEMQAVSIANVWKGKLSQMDRLKHLGTEYAEFIEAVLSGDKDKILEEAGDMCYIILHVLHKCGIPDDEINIGTLIVNSSDKLELKSFKNK